jgi:hypothetical protein
MAQRGDKAKRTRFLGGVDITLRGAGSNGNDPLRVGDGTDVGLKIQVPASVVVNGDTWVQAANCFEIDQPDGTTLFAIGPNGGPAPQAGLGMLGVAHAIFNFALDGGAISTIVPALNALIPANAILIGATINPTTAPLSGGAATIAVGTSAGSSTTSLLAATGKATFSIDALINGVPTIAVPIKMTAAGNITVTVAAAALTAGVIEVFVFFVQPLNS